MCLRNAIALTILLATGSTSAVAEQSLTFSIRGPWVDGKPTVVGTCSTSLDVTLPISAVAFSPDGNTLAVGGYGEVLLWDLAGGKLDRRLGVDELTDQVHALAFIDEGRSLAVGSGSPGRACQVKLFDLQTDKVTHAFDEPGDVVYTLVASPDGKFLAAGGADRKIHVWNLADRTLAKTITAYQGWVHGLAFSDDGKRMAAGSSDRTLELWDADTWESIHRFTTPEAVRAVALTGNGSAIIGAIGGPRERGVRMGVVVPPKTATASAFTKQFIPRLRPASTDPGMPLDVTWDTKLSRVYVACDDSTIRALDSRNGRLLATVRGHTDWVYTVVRRPDGKALASGSADGTVKLWNVADGRLLATLVQLAPGTDRWVIMTPHGYFAASSPESLTWTKPDGSAFPAKQATERFQNAETLVKVMTPRDAVVPEWKRRAEAERRGKGK